MDALLSLADSSSVLCTHLTSSLSLSAQQTSALAQEQETPPLALLSDAAQFLRAQTTKLSLLAINTPFTPSALITVLMETHDTALPSLATAASLVGDLSSYPTSFYDEAKFLVKTALQEYASLMTVIKHVARANESQAEAPDKQLVTTAAGRVWSACDALIGFAKDGVVTFVVKKAHTHLDLVKDGMRELSEWDPEEDDDDDDYFLDDGSARDLPTADKSNDNLSQAANPAEDLDDDSTERLVGRKEHMLRVLNIVTKIYPAIETYRLKPMAKEHSNIRKSTLTKLQISRLASLLSEFRTLPDLVDEAVGCLYESDLDGSAKNLAAVVDCAKRAVDIARNTSSDEAGQDKQSNEDGKYSKWADAFVRALDGLVKKE